MTIGQLKKVLRNALNECENYEDNQEIELENNTYYVKNAKYFLGVSGYDGGYLDLNNIEVAEDDDACPECDRGRIEWNEDGTAGICDKCGAEV